MAAGATSGHGGRGSSATLESSLDRRFQGVTNTMESIQGLSTWCIENKKYHNLIVRYWMKWLRKSEAPHRLNLFYLANDVIQNCKRKNAIIYRNSFAEVLPEAALLVKDGKVRKSVERIFSIWEERNVYPEELTSELKASLVKKDPPPAPVNPKAALKSKIVAEFAPQTFIEQLSAYKRSVEEAELKEKQLSALRVDVCSTEGLKRLKDKAGGKKFSKDFEEGSGKLQEFVGFLEQQMQGGPPLLEALGNADVFYEMQYKEVKIVANAYKAFANRVSNLKRKLDALKATLPDPDDSPIPSPSEDAPSPTGSESPFHGMGVGGAKGEGPTAMANAMETDIDGRAMDDGDEAGISLGDVPSPLSSPGGSHGPAHGEGDNRDVEDMELSEDEETESTGIIVEERKEKPAPASVSKPAPAPAAPAAAPPSLCTSEEPPAKQAPLPATPTPTPVPTPTPAPTPTPTPTPSTPGTPATPLPVNLANVDLGKISSILSSLTSVMKSTGVSPVSRPSPGTPTTPSAHASALKPPNQSPGASQAANPLASILSRVDMNREGILSALSKTQAQSAGLQGLSSLLHSVAGNASTGASKERPPNSTAAAPPHGHGYPVPETPPSSSATAPSKTPATPTAPKQKLPTGNSYKRELDRERGREQEKERDSAAAVSASPTSLESKIHKFLQGNPGFRGLGLSIPILGGGPGGSSDSPLLGSENVDGTPVRDETGGTPTQDEMMDKPGAESLGLLSDPGPLGGAKALPGPGGHDLSPTAYRSDPWDAAISPQALFAQAEERDADYRSARYSFGTDKKPAKSALKAKGEDAAKRKTAGSSSSSSSAHQDPKPGHTKARKEGHGGGNNLGKPAFYDGGGGERRASAGGEPHPHHSLPASERPKSTGARKDEGSKEREGEGEGGKEKAPGSASPVHRIETVVSSTSCGEGAPIETLGYSNRRMSGERIQTVESIRVIGRGPGETILSS
ncbi:regulation of nuclear pre-mRNA domain-containing protein 2-like [Conger conger]|uniref:regulation of nuclear pre-mRNA domain-containing protein 2-like n=1 Tax=Conger conger TaxID=82655 RepID=UPI002A59F900|nr:regulation of nuclear pre-mRNA domain-containing protein 2-like [Conger conger]